MPGILKNTVQSEEQNVKETYIVKQTAARMEIAAAGWKVVFDKVTGQLLEYRVRKAEQAKKNAAAHEDHPPAYFYDNHVTFPVSHGSLLCGKIFRY